MPRFRGGAVTPCPFCRVVAGEEPALIVGDFPQALAFIPLAPAAWGHTLVIPKPHIETLWGLQDLSTSVLYAIRFMETKLRKALRPDGMNLIQSTGTAAGQTVPHLHFHLVPRWDGGPPRETCGPRAGSGGRCTEATKPDFSGEPEWLRRSTNRGGAMMDEPIPDPLKDPWRVVSMALLCQARNEVVPEALADAVTDAAVYLSCGTFVAAGMSPEKAMSQFEDRDYEIHLSFDGATDEFGLRVEWADGETTITASQGQPQP